MRRRAEDGADTLQVLFRATREFAKEGSQLPARSALLLYFLGTQPEGQAAFAEVREECGLGQSQTSRLIVALVDAGLIVSAAPADDRRKSNLRLTAKGRSVIERIIQAAIP